MQRQCIEFLKCPLKANTYISSSWISLCRCNKNGHPINAGCPFLSATILVAILVLIVFVAVLVAAVLIAVLVLIIHR